MDETSKQEQTGPVAKPHTVNCSLEDPCFSFPLCGISGGH